MEDQSQMQYLIPSFINYCRKRLKFVGPKLEPNGQITVKIVLSVALPVRSDTVIWPTVIKTVLYGIVTAGAVITVHYQNLRRKCRPGRFVQDSKGAWQLRPSATTTGICLSRMFTS
jgi:hypothetical protein